MIAALVLAVTASARGSAPSPAVEAGAPAGGRTQLDRDAPDAFPEPATTDARSAAEVEGALHLLESDSSTRRAEGERLLARVLAPEHAARVRTVLASGAWECALRVVSALAIAPRGLDLAVRFAGDADPRVRALGAQAVEERIARWTPGWDRPASARGIVMSALLGKFGEFLALDPRTGTASDGRVDRAVAALVRGARGMPPVVVVPGARGAAGARSQPELRGSAEALLSQLARAHGLTITGLGFDDDVDGRAARCVLLSSTADEDQDERLGTAVVREWCTSAASGATLAARREAARALGACGWPDAVAWMEERWLATRAASTRDLVWLDGLTAAADRGALAPCWRQRAEQEWCYRYVAEAALEPAPELRSERVAGIARALALAGPRAADGDDVHTLAALADGPGPSGPRGARLVGGAAPAVATDSERAELARRAALWGADASPASAALLLQALRTRAALPDGGGAVFELAEPEALFERASRRGELERLPALLAAAGAVPPARWDDPARLSKGWPAELARAACGWSLRSPRPPAAAARHLARLLAAAKVPPEDGVRVVELVRGVARAGGAERVRAVIGSAELAEHGAMLAVALGLADDATRARVGAAPALRSSGPAGTLHALALGELAAEGDRTARTALITALADAGTLALAGTGLDWAVASLRARRDEAGERDLVQAVRSAAQEGPAALRARYRPDTWPVATMPEALVLDEFVREAPRELR